MSFHWLLVAARVRLAEPCITTRLAEPTFENMKNLLCEAPPGPRQDWRQVRAQLRRLLGHFSLPAFRPWRRRRNVWFGTSLLFCLSMISFTRTPRFCARSSALAPSLVAKFQVKNLIVEPRLVELTERMILRKIARRAVTSPRGLLNVGPFFGRKLSGAASAGPVAPTGTRNTRLVTSSRMIFLGKAGVQSRGHDLRHTIVASSQSAIRERSGRRLRAGSRNERFQARQSTTKSM